MQSSHANSLLPIMGNGYLQILLLLLCCNFIVSCKESNQLQEGDILFQDLNCGPLCNAIEAVTDGVDGKDFSHCAMVVSINDTLKVVEAIGDKVQVNSLKNFFKRSDDTLIVKNITISRVNQKYTNLIGSAVAFAKKQIGKPYDDEFLLNNNKWYCSELIYQAFREANNHKDFFVLQPMTFKDPNTKDYFPAWIDYYKSLNKLIPEGQAGINPGLISRSNKLTMVKIDNIPQ